MTEGHPHALHSDSHQENYTSMTKEFWNFWMYVIQRWLHIQISATINYIILDLVNKENISNSFATSCMFDLACVWIGSRGWHRSVSWIVKDLKSAGSLVKMPRGGHPFIPNHVCQFDKQIKLERKLFKLQLVQVARIFGKHKISVFEKWSAAWKNFEVVIHRLNLRANTVTGTSGSLPGLMSKLMRRSPEQW